MGVLYGVVKEMINEHIREYLTPLWLFVFVVIGAAVGIIWKAPAMGAVIGAGAFLVTYLVVGFIVKMLRIKLDQEQNKG